MTNEEQKAYDLAVDNHERAMARVAELEREVAALKAHPGGVVLPERKKAAKGDVLSFQSEGWNACLDEAARLDAVARLNQQPASGGVDERETIRAVFLRNGFTIKEGQTDLKPYVYDAAHELLSIARAALAQSERVPEWIPVSELLPESERTVLAFYKNSHGKSRRVRAEYITHMSKSADDGWDCDADAYYDEATDESYWPAGWYEVIDNWDDLTHMVIHEGEVTHWMPLPAAPSPSKQGGV